MKPPSRSMAPAKTRKVIGLPGTVVMLAIFASPFVWMACQSALCTAVIGPGALLNAWLFVRTNRKHARQQAERSRDSICTFARGLPARDHDTWVVRAIYKELSLNRGLALQPGDKLVKDLGMLPEELENCLIETARRSRRSLKGLGQNPRLKTTETVRDLVVLLESQPREPSPTTVQLPPPLLRGKVSP